MNKQNRHKLVCREQIDACQLELEGCVRRRMQGIEKYDLRVIEVVTGREGTAQAM